MWPEGHDVMVRSLQCWNQRSSRLISRCGILPQQSKGYKWWVKFNGSPWTASPTEFSGIALVLIYPRAIIKLTPKAQCKTDHTQLIHYTCLLGESNKPTEL